jgi:hypothetical protein
MYPQAPPHDAVLSLLCNLINRFRALTPRSIGSKACGTAARRRRSRCGQGESRVRQWRPLRGRREAGAASRRRHVSAGFRCRCCCDCRNSHAFHRLLQVRVGVGRRLLRRLAQRPPSRLGHVQIEHRRRLHWAVVQGSPVWQIMTPRFVVT